MAILIKLDNKCTIVANKITAFFINKDDDKKLTIWLEGNGIISHTHTTKEKCLENFNIIHETLKEL